MQTDPVIGYYVHHQGSGHAHRALSISRACALPVTGLSTAAAPAGWPGQWVRLADDTEPEPLEDKDAHDRLHYVPLGGAGLRSRMNAISGWIEQQRPALMVVDVSVEVATLSRLHGVPVVTAAMPGHRHDPGHRLGYDLSAALIAPWPAAAGPMWDGEDSDVVKTSFVGAISRYAPVDRPGPANRQVVVLNGNGGDGPTPAEVAAAARATPDWDWVHLDRAHGRWVEDPWPLLCSAAVVVSHAGQNALAEIAAARRPAVVIPQLRPFAEQHVMADALSRLGWPPVSVRESWPVAHDWPALLDSVAALDGGRWSDWNDGRGATRAADRLTELAMADRTAVPA